MPEATTTHVPATVTPKTHWWKDKAFAIQVGVGAAIAAAAAYIATKTAQR